MLLEMYMNDQLIDAVEVCPLSVRTKYAEHLNQLKAELIKKHKTVLSTVGKGPAFILSGVQSCINYFVPLPVS
jgi:hypothetical protein